MDEWTEEDEAWLKSPDVQSGIRRGMTDYHFGRLFSQEEVFSERLYFKLRVLLKRIYWRLKKPIQRYTHRNCEICRRLSNG